MNNYGEGNKTSIQLFILSLCTGSALDFGQLLSTILVLSFSISFKILVLFCIIKKYKKNEQILKWYFIALKTFL